MEIEVEVRHEAEGALETEVAGLHEVVASHQEDGVVTEPCENERTSCAYARRSGIPTGDWVQAGCNMKSTTMSIRACRNANNLDQKSTSNTIKDGNRICIARYI